MKTLYKIFILSSLCLGGCVSYSGVLPAKDSKSFFDDAVYKGETKIHAEDTTGSEQYRAFQRGESGFVLIETVRDNVEQQAFMHCEKMGKSLKLLQERSSVPPHILGNFPRVEFLFVCIPKSNPSNSEDQLYVKLTNLKKLLDNGTITKDEFEQQKMKILNQK